MVAYLIVDHASGINEAARREVVMIADCTNISGNVVEPEMMLANKIRTLI